MVRDMLGPAALSTEDAMNPRLRLVWKMVSAEILRRQGDLAAELTLLRELAAHVGGQISGQFCVSPANHIVPFKVSGFWWLQRYTDILLRIGDVHVRRGVPLK
jgi:hypothetical protein